MCAQTSATLDYASPEQLRDLKLDERTDLYSLGTIFYELLCGCLPFSDRGNAQARILAKVVEPAPKLPRTRPCLDRNDWIVPLVLDLLALDREDRPRFARDVLSRLLD